ncbi:hypothetical protein FJ656_17065, partial [Schumannella luteola]
MPASPNAIPARPSLAAHCRDHRRRGLTRAAPGANVDDVHIRGGRDVAQKVTPYLWFQGDLQDALDLYTSVFDDAEVLSTTERDGGLFAATFRMGGIQL